MRIIGPESPINVDVVQKLTSILEVPHIVKSGKTTTPYLHHLAKESEYFIVQGILEVINALRWNRFTLITRKYKDNNHDDDVQVIAKKVTMAAIARGLCVLTSDEGDIASMTSHIVHIGIPLKNFINKVNGTILIASEGSFTSYINKINSTSSILFLEDARPTDINDLQARVLDSKWWINKNNEDNYNPEVLRDVRWLKDAIDIYTTSLDILCKKKKCSNEMDPAEWNTIIATVLASHNAKTAITPKKMRLLLKNSNDKFVEQIGEISILENHAKLHWTQDNIHENLKNKEFVHGSFVEMSSSFNDESKINCAALLEVSNNNNSDDVTQIFFAAFDDHEWWTMVAIVGGIGISMFTFGFIAVYIVYINIRGPKRLRNNNGRRISRDMSLRQVSTPIHVNNNSPPSAPLPPQRLARFQARRESNRSIKSNISDKSV
ncbi:hypothetical protein PV326_002924 [Microctonus aethiopoides]|nr:hypothetical protein PV326_002924 [Microctonus aethiopoides]